MGKKVRPASTYTEPELGDKEENYLEDRISQLPDEILVSIVSLLTIKEAARTSVLSHRWERLWTSFMGSLDFDVTQTVYDIEKRCVKPLIEERPRYISWVNQVLSSLDGATLDGFRVSFNLNNDSRCHIDKWIEFALEKRVQRLELDLKFDITIASPSVPYTFTLDRFAHIKQPGGLYSINTLTSLSFSRVNVSGELIEYFLSNCPLERLCVEFSDQLLTLKVAGTTLLLKYLGISFCRYLTSVDISAPNLVYLKYFGQRVKLDVKNVPQLVEVCIGGAYFMRINYAFRCLSSYLSQLETLKVDIGIKDHKKFKPLVEFTKLKHFILRVTATEDQCLLGWTSVIKASPFLHRFTLELLCGGTPRILRKKMQKIPKCSHKSLKVVELVGFVGCTTDVELVMYFIKNAPALEKIIIDRRTPLRLGTPLEYWEDNEQIAATERALQLKRRIPPGVKLVLI